MRLTTNGARWIQGGSIALSVAAAVGTLAVTSVTPSASIPSPVVAAACVSGQPCLTATPQSGIVDGQFIKVSFTGYTPFVGIVFRECRPSPQAVATDCTLPAQNIIGVADATGAGATFVPIQVGSQLHDDAGTETFACDATNPCVLAGLTDPTDLTTAVFVPLSFAASQSDCPPFPGDALLGVGSASAYRALYAWEFTVCKPPQSLSVGYTLKNSPDGIFAYMNDLADFAVTGPVTEPPPVADAAHTYKFAPLSSSALVLGYRIYDRAGPQLTDLVLTPDLIAQIFLGKIANWNANPAIMALNPGVLFPTKISPIERAEHSAQTLVFTSWLSAVAPKIWTTGPTDTFPVPAAGATGKTGSDGVGLAVVNPLTDFFDFGNIGFMDSSTAAYYGLPTMKIKRADGSIVAASTDAIIQAMAAAKQNPDGTLAFDYTDPTAGGCPTTGCPLAWPMPMPTYMMAPVTVTKHLGQPIPGTTADPLVRGAALASFLRYSVQAGQANLPAGYAPLAPSQVSESLSVADAIPAPAAPTPPPSPSPSPSATSTATPTPVATTAPTETPAPAATPTPTAAPAPAAAPASRPTRTPTPAAAEAAPPPSAGRPPSAPSGSRLGSGPNFGPLPRSPVLPAVKPAASAAPKPSPTPGTGGSDAAAGTTLQTPLQLGRLGDWIGARYLIPLLLALALLGLGGGGALELVLRRRALGEAAGG